MTRAFWALRQPLGRSKLDGCKRVVASAVNVPKAYLSRTVSDGQKAPNIAARFDVPKERRFIGFDAYRKAMDCLTPGDVVILATPPAFRWVHFKYAIEKRLNVFMEKPVTVDAPTTKRMFAAVA